MNLQVPHEPIREDLARMERLLQPHYFDGTKPWKVAAFFKWYNDWFYPNVSPLVHLFPPLVGACFWFGGLSTCSLSVAFTY